MLILVVALVLSVIFALCVSPMFNVKAETVSPKGTNYFSGIKETDISFEENVVKFNFTDTEEVEFKSKLAIDDFQIALIFADNVESAKLILEYDSFYVNGNENAEGEFDKSIENTFDLTVSTDTLVDVSVADGKVYVNSACKAEDYYKIRVVDKAIAKVSISVKSKNQEKSSFSIKYVDQKVSDSEHNYKQTFELTSGSLVAAYPVINLDADIFVKTKTGYVTRAFMLTDASNSYNLAYNVHSVLGNVSSSDLYPTTDDVTKVSIPTNDKDKVTFKAKGNATFNISAKDAGVEVDYATYTVEVIEKDDGTNTAPEYITTDAQAIKAFNAAIKKQIIIEESAEGVSYISLGSTLEIPSFEDLVVDDRTPYDKLSKILYYRTNTKNTSLSSMKVTLTEDGDYLMFVVFTDSEGESMDKDEDFIKVEKEGDKEIYKGEGKYAPVIIRFSIEDNADLTVKAPSSESLGFVGVKCTTANFTIEAVGYNQVYTLKYNKNANATADNSGWVEVKAIKDIDSSYSDANFTYAQLSAIAYDGKLTFTPNATGSYMIECKIVSDYSSRIGEGHTIIRVSGAPSVVQPGNYWLENNVWSVVFLSIGFVCLVGIVALLFVKPKDKGQKKSSK